MFDLDSWHEIIEALKKKQNPYCINCFWCFLGHFYAHYHVRIGTRFAKRNYLRFWRFCHQQLFYVDTENHFTL